MLRLMMISLSILSVGLSVGCESAESEDIRTSGMYPNMSIVSDGASSQADVIIRVGGPTSNTFVNLTSGDTLTVAVNDDQPVTMTENNLGDYYQYSATLNETEEDTQFTFALTRENDDSAPESIVTLPAPFSISSPLSENLFSRENDDVVVTWEPSGQGDSMTLYLGGDCIEDYSDASLDDTGSHTISAGTLALDEEDDQFDSSCSVDVTIRRNRVGTVDAVFDEGVLLTATQVRSSSFQSEP